jgi:hypothetical protein
MIIDYDKQFFKWYIEHNTCENSPSIRLRDFDYCSFCISSDIANLDEIAIDWWNIKDKSWWCSQTISLIKRGIFI